MDDDDNTDDSGLDLTDLTGLDLSAPTAAPPPQAPPPQPMPQQALGRAVQQGAPVPATGGPPPAGAGPQQMQARAQAQQAQVQQAQQAALAQQAREEMLDNAATANTNDPDMAAERQALAEKYGTVQTDYSTLKQLLNDTAERMRTQYAQQVAPTTAEKLMAIGEGLGEPSGFGGFAGSLANADRAMLPLAQQQRMLPVQMQMLADRYGVEGQQAQIAGDQVGVPFAEKNIEQQQGFQNQYKLMLPQLQARLMQQRLTSPTTFDANGNVIPNTGVINAQAALEQAKARAQMQGQLGALGGFGGSSGGAPGAAPGGPALPSAGGAGASGNGGSTLAQQIAAYRFPMPTFNARNPLGIAYGNALASQVSALNPNFNAANFQIAQRTRQAFDTGTQGQNLRFVDNALGHLNTYDQIMQSLNTGNVKGANALSQLIGRQVGNPSIASADAVQQLLAEELTKAILPAGGTGAEREAKEEQISASLSPQQWNAVKGSFNSLLTTQLENLRQQYGSSLNFIPPQLTQGEFMSKLSPRAQQLLQQSDAARAAGSAGNTGSGRAPPQAVQYLLTHPELAPAFRQKYGYLPQGIGGP